MDLKLEGIGLCTEILNELPFSGLRLRISNETICSSHQRRAEPVFDVHDIGRFQMLA